MNEMPTIRRVKKPASKYDRPASLNLNLRPITRKEFFAKAAARWIQWIGLRLFVKEQSVSG